MKRSFAPSIADIVFLVIAPMTAILRTIKLTHSDGDLAAHIRMGETMLQTGEIPAVSLASFTAATDPLVAHGWLSEIVFALLFRAGGLALISVVAGIVVGLTHASMALFLRRKGADPRWALAAALVSLAIASTHWLARPHMFSILAAALTLYLLESGSRKRFMLFALLFAVWANLHGGWLYGLLMICAYIAGNLIEAAPNRESRGEWLGAARSNLIALAIAAAATLLNPFGVALHREVLAGATSPELAGRMAEFLAPDFQTLAPLPFLVVLLGSFGLLAVTRKRMPFPHLVLVIVSLFFALRSFRNIALFGVSAWPLLALHAANAWPAHRRRFPWFQEIARLDHATRPGLYGIPVAALLLGLGLTRGRALDTQIIRSDFSGKIFPVAAVEKARQARLDERIFEEWSWGGYIMYAWPSARLIVDPLKFNDATVHAYLRIGNARPGWQDEIRRWRIGTVIVEPTSRLAESLGSAPDWKVWYRDSTAVVFRSASDTVAVPTSD